MAGWDSFRNSVKKAVATPTEDDDCGVMMEEYPVISQFLGRYTDDGGRIVVGGSILFFYEGGKFKACLVDKYTQRKAFVTLAPGRDPWAQVEALMGKGELDWRAERARR